MEEDSLESVAGAFNLDLTQYEVVTLDSGVSLLNKGVAPSYSPTQAGDYPGSQAMEFYAKNGSVSYQQYRTAKGGTKAGPRAGQVGRKIGDRLQDDLRKVLVHCYLENFDRLIHSETGQLRLAVKDGDWKNKDTELVGFTFTVKDMEGLRRPWERGNVQSDRPSTQYYGPIVFLGRGAIISPQKNMRFFSKGEGRSTPIVGAAEPRNIFLLSAEQIDRVNTVVLKPIAEDTTAWIKSVMEGKPDGS
jgi:hypothetical protein